MLDTVKSVLHSDRNDVKLGKLVVEPLSTLRKAEETFKNIRPPKSSKCSVASNNFLMMMDRNLMMCFVISEVQKRLLSKKTRKS